MAVDFLRGRPKGVSAVQRAQGSADSVGFAAVSLFELLNPIYHRKLQSQERAVKSFAHQLRLFPFDAAAAEESAKIMGSLLRMGQPLNALDVMIAGTASANGAEELISLDEDFGKLARVTGMKIKVVD